jgi:ComF family protein
LNNTCLKIKHLLKNVLFPQSCMLCKCSRAEEVGICLACLKDLSWLSNASCPQCGLSSHLSLHCGACLSVSPYFDETKALFSYDFPINAVIQQYKYQHQLSLAHTFAALMLKHFKLKDTDLIIPMPLHPKRLKERGFNQSLEIAKLLSTSLNIPSRHVCERIKFSPPQASLPIKDRVNNMKDAFICNEDLTGQNIILIDDVMTTGASLNALAKAVKAKGASHVECWLIARTLTQ